MDQLPQTNAPRTGKNSEEKGHYDFVARITNAIVDRGDTIVVEIFFTGYGVIDNSKFAFYPSISILDLNGSSCLYSIKSEVSANGGEVLSWGGLEWKFDKGTETGVVIDLSAGIVHSSWRDQTPTLFFDAFQITPCPVISTETTQLDKAPITFKLKINKKASPGSHFLHFGFTYYNGSEWGGSTQQIPFTIKNTFQRHEILIAWIGLVGVILALLASIYSIIDIAPKYWPFANNSKVEAAKNNSDSTIKKNIRDSDRVKPFINLKIQGQKNK